MNSWACWIINFEQLQSQNTIQFFLTVLSFHFLIFLVISPSLVFFYFIYLLSFVLYSVLSHFFYFISLYYFCLCFLSMSLFLKLFFLSCICTFSSSLWTRSASRQSTLSLGRVHSIREKIIFILFFVIVHYLYLPSFEL